MRGEGWANWRGSFSTRRRGEAEIGDERRKCLRTQLKLETKLVLESLIERSGAVVAFLGIVPGEREIAFTRFLHWRANAAPAQE